MRMMTWRALSDRPCPQLGADRYCLPRHRMTVDSRNEGSTAYDLLKQRGFKCV